MVITKVIAIGFITLCIATYIKTGNWTMPVTAIIASIGYFLFENHYSLYFVPIGVMGYNIPIAGQYKDEEELSREQLLYELLINSWIFYVAEFVIAAFIRWGVL